MPRFEPLPLSLQQLLLDPNNYRFHEDQHYVRAAGHRFHELSVQERAWKRLRDDGLRELKNSLLRNGFMPMEPLVARAYEYSEDHYLVVEGNRRLAALLWIRRDIDAGVAVPEQVHSMLLNIPAIVVSHEEDDPAFFEALMGVRHISGTKEWGGYQRAKLVVTLRDDRNMEPTEIAERVGMSTVEINRRYRAYKALQQMKENEEFEEYATPELYALFHEAVSLPLIRDWLGWDATTFSFQNESELEQFYALICPSSAGGVAREPKIRGYGDVRALRGILPRPDARASLLDLDRPFVDAAAIAKEEELSRAWTTKVDSAYNALQNLGFRHFTNLSDEDVARLQSISDLARNIIGQHERLRQVAANP